MAVQVVDSIDRSKVPFLRGILTRSLVNAGLSFDRAYEIANEIRDEIGSEEEITTEELKSRVKKYLKSSDEKEVLRRYSTGSIGQPIRVIDRDGIPVPFSKGLLANSLQICSLSSERQFVITRGIERYLVENRMKEIGSLELASITYKYLVDNESAEMARRYLTWREYLHSDRPLLILIGGTTGCGKSTISSEIAHKLDIVRTQSTDMLREVMRLMIPERLLPTLHTSSFNTWEALPSWKGQPARLDTHFEQGYLTQSGHVGIGIEGVLQRAERERVSLIVEGVHIHPGLQRSLMDSLNVIVVPIILAVVKKKRLRKQLVGRGAQVVSRRSERYLNNFDAIWRLQDFLLAEADRYDIPVVPNEDKEETIKLVMDEIADTVTSQFSGDEKSVFGKKASVGT